MGENAALKKAWPGVVEAANLIGSDQIQSRCTIVGNLCNASPAADSVPAMIAAEAKAGNCGSQGSAHGAGGEGSNRTGFDVARERRGSRGHHLAETSTEIGRCVSAFHSANRDGYRSGQRRCQLDVGQQAGGEKRRGFALGAVAPTVVLVPAAARAIIGTKLDDGAIAKLAKACAAACAPIDDKRGTIEFRTEVAGVLAERATKIAYQRAGGE